jgi:Fe-S-cluster containining protein
MPSEIATISQLKSAVATILAEISSSCRDCAYPDCQGYPWIVAEEEPDLLRAGLSLVQMNGADGPIYLDTFSRDESGAIMIGKGGALCPYRGADGGCSVHESRPLTCHLYPLSMEIKDGAIVWAVHDDCEFIQRRKAAGTLETLLDEFRDTTASLSPPLRRALHTTMSRAAAVSKPITMDCYIVLGPVEG